MVVICNDRLELDPGGTTRSGGEAGGGFGWWEAGR